MPPQGLNLNECGIGSDGTAPQARNFAFLSHRSVKTSLFVFHFLFIRRLSRLSFRLFFWGGNDSLGAFAGMASLAPLDLPVVTCQVFLTNPMLRVFSVKLIS